MESGNVRAMRAMVRVHGYDADHVPSRRRHRKPARLCFASAQQGVIAAVAAESCRPGTTIPGFCVVAGLLGCVRQGRRRRMQANPQIVDQETVAEGYQLRRSRVGTFELPDPLGGARAGAGSRVGAASRGDPRPFPWHVYGRSPGKPRRLTSGGRAERSRHGRRGDAQRVAIVSSRQGDAPSSDAVPSQPSRSRYGTGKPSGGFRCSARKNVRGNADQSRKEKSGFWTANR